ncbi:MAG: histidine phosphatase family protein [Nocardioides sp.]
MGHLLLVRHGQASFGADDYDVLSERGWEQARVLGGWLRGLGVTPNSVVHGSMRRHRETAEAMTESARWGRPPVTVDAGWDEFDHVGLVAGHPDLTEGVDHTLIDRKRFQEIFEEVTARWTAGDPMGDQARGQPDHEVDTQESYAAFLLRVRGALARAVQGCGSGETVVVVTSGGPIAAVAATLVDPSCVDDQAAAARLWARFNTVVVNAAYSRVLVGSTGARLLTFNEHHHLSGPQVTYR